LIFVHFSHYYRSRSISAPLVSIKILHKEVVFVDTWLNI
jgi:hypothetical protein